MGEVPVVGQKWDSKNCWNKKTVFAGQVSVALSLKDDSQGRGIREAKWNNKPLIV